MTGVQTCALPIYGFASYVDNVGEVKNNGWEASASVYVIRNAERDINWIIGGQLTYNKNYVSKLSEAIKAQNEAYLKEDVDVANLFYEGRPQNGIYVVRSLGIDPANGQEIFLDKDGNRKNLSDWLGNYVYIDVWATWCGPCMRQGPIVEELGEEGYAVGKLDVDQNMELAQQFRVMSIPTLIIFKNGAEAHRLVGLTDKEELKKLLDE